MNKLAILSVVAVLATVYFISYQTSQNSQLESDFYAFMTEYGKSYNSDSEYEFRMEVFRKNMEQAKVLSEMNPLAEFGVTEFSDQTEEEMMRRMGDYQTDNFGNAEFSNQSAEPNGNKDWRGKMQAIQNQGSCGSCWAFAATATFETYLNIKKAKNIKLSEQELVDCVTTCSGCNGGLANLAYDWLVSNYMCTGASYKYVAKKSTCLASSCSKVDHDSGSTILSTGEKGIMSQLDIGPVSISVDASTWSSYRGGIMETGCGQNTNHAVVVSAYATDSKGGYWIIRNSWGSSWGNSGFMYLRYGKNLCNVGRKPCFPKL
mmetsp:Transcript_34657/g.40113  ORF Transcript_34657/g.40113 Transcript_34657/m.40113 type:complete len:318 (-) Transcript_34657:26-979(-)